MDVTKVGLAIIGLPSFIRIVGDHAEGLRSVNDPRKIVEWHSTWNNWYGKGHGSGFESGGW